MWKKRPKSIFILSNDIDCLKKNGWLKWIKRERESETNQIIEFKKSFEHFNEDDYLKVNGSNCNQWQFNRLKTKGWSNKRGT